MNSANDEMENEENPKRAKLDNKEEVDVFNEKTSSSVDSKPSTKQVHATSSFEMNSNFNESDIRETQDNNIENCDASNTESHENAIDMITPSLQTADARISELCSGDDSIENSTESIGEVHPCDNTLCNSSIPLVVDIEERNPGPSTTRSSQPSSRNYRRRVDESSSDEDQFRIVRNTSTEQSDIPTDRPNVFQTVTAMEEIANMSDTNSNNEDSSDSMPDLSSRSSSSEWTLEEGYSSTDSLERFHFEPSEEIDEIVSSILKKQKPSYTWRSVPSIMYRQNGFDQGERFSHKVTTPYNFQARVAGSLYAVERLKLVGKLTEHQGCINCLNFSKNGKYLASGSDDLSIKIWDWSRQKIQTTIYTKHTANIFQAKFVDYNGYENIIELVSSDQSGSVRHFAIRPCGSVESEKIMCTSPRAVHKLGFPSNRPYEVLSAGEDSRVILMDLRESTATKLFKAKCPQYSIACHPLDSNEFCIGGQDQFVRVYDRRNVKSALRIHCPQHLQERRVKLISVTSAVYNYVGTEILATYSNENIYLFDCSNNDPGGFLHKYSGHRNNRTIKGVNFYGPRSEFVVSGSENPGHVFFWEKETEAICNMQIGDVGGVVNVIETHPYFPFVATSGLSKEIRLWQPTKEENPDLSDIQKFVMRNIYVQLSRNADRSTQMDFIQFILNRVRQRAEQIENRENDDDVSRNDDTSDDDEDFGDNSMDSYELNPCNTS